MERGFYGDGVFSELPELTERFLEEEQDLRAVYRAFLMDSDRALQEALAQWETDREGMGD